jgi:hypothetical protein
MEMEAAFLEILVCAVIAECNVFCFVFAMAFVSWVFTSPASQILVLQDNSAAKIQFHVYICPCTEPNTYSYAIQC